MFRTENMGGGHHHSALSGVARAAVGCGIVGRAMNRLVAIIGGVGLVLAFSLLPVPAAAAPNELLPVEAAVAPTQCADVVFFGLRGSGEPANPDQENMGPYVFSVYESFARSARSAGINVTPVGLDANEYPAVAVKVLLSDALITGVAPSVLQGTAALGQRTLRYLREDLTTCLVLVGYSQGAWVIGDYFWQNPAIEARVLSRFTAVLLFGDPRFDSSSDVDQGAAEGAAGLLRWQGPLFGSVSLPADLQLRLHGLYYEGQSDTVRSYCVPEDPVCDFRGVTHESFNECAQEVPWCDHFGYGAGYLGAGINFLTDKVVPLAPGRSGAAPVITGASTYQEDPMVYATVRYTGDAVGFGFRGTKGSGWAPETHPFSDPSYGRPSPGRIDYPFNHGCGTASAYESDIEFWVYDDSGRESPRMPIHLACASG